jgi:hypothetical protein
MPVLAYRGKQVTQLGSFIASLETTKGLAYQSLGIHVQRQCSAATSNSYQLMRSSSEKLMAEPSSMLMLPAASCDSVIW